MIVSSAPARAADPAGEVLRLVPPETRICLVVRDLRTHLRAIEGSPFEKWLEQSALGKHLNDPAEMAKIEQLETFLKEQFGVGFDQLLDDVLGDVVVLAYQPGPPGKPDDELGVVFVNARKPDLLATLVEKLNDFQKKTGEIKSVRPLKSTRADRTSSGRSPPASGSSTSSAAACWPSPARSGRSGR